MSHCLHTSWLQVAAGDSLSLCDGGRLDRLLHSLSDPASQKPSLNFFIGGESKDIILPQLFTLKKGVIGYGNALRADLSSCSSKNPIWVAESDPSLQTLEPRKFLKCHKSTSYPIKWKVESCQYLWNIIHARLFFIFTDVICIFADDLGGLEGVIKYLETWSSFQPSSSFSKHIRPRIVIFSSKKENDIISEKLEVAEFRYRLLQEGKADIYDSFSEIITTNDAKGLRELLSKQMDQIRQIRVANFCHFSALHISFFFKRALRNLAESPNKPFNLISESRLMNVPDQDFEHHLTRFLDLSSILKIPYDAIASFISSSILMDAYPPGMHCKFDIRI